MSGYQIGQYRFRDASLCISQVQTPSEPVSYRVVSFDDETSAMGSSNFRDVVISPSNPFVEDQDYYVKIEIPQDLNYELSFDIKLLKQEQGVDVYQFLKRITIPRGGDSENVYPVVLYETTELETIYEENEDGEEVPVQQYKVNAMIPLTYSAINPTIKDAIYIKHIDGEPDTYWLGKGGSVTGDSAYTQTYNYNDSSILASWRQETTTKSWVFETIFRPVEAGFTQILIEMDRGAEDLNTQQEIDGEMVYGRMLDIEFISEHFELYSLTNLVPSMSGNSSIPLSKIGVWSHPELYMAINGEGIKIGPSGYYELDVIDIESLSIMARGPQDNFTVDYEYLIREEDQGN